MPPWFESDDWVWDWVPRPYSENPPYLDLDFEDQFVGPIPQNRYPPYDDYAVLPPADYSRGPWQHGRSYIRFQKPGFTPEMAADDQNHAKMAGEAARRYQQEQRQQRIQAEQQRMRGGRSFEGDQGRGFNEIDRMMRERPKPGLRPEDFGTDQSGALGVVPRHLRGIRTYEGRALQDLLRQMTPTLAEASHGASRMLGDPRLQMGVDFLANPGHYLESLADPVRSWWQTQQQDAEIDAWDYQHQTGKYRPMTAIRG